MEMQHRKVPDSKLGTAVLQRRLTSAVLLGTEATEEPVPAHSSILH